MMLMRADWLDVREPHAAMMIESSRSALSKFMRFQASGDTSQMGQVRRIRNRRLSEYQAVEKVSGDRNTLISAFRGRPGHCAHYFQRPCPFRRDHYRNQLF